MVSARQIFLRGCELDLVSKAWIGGYGNGWELVWMMGWLCC